MMPRPSLFFAAIAMSSIVSAEIATYAMPKLPDAHGFAGAFAGVSEGCVIVAGGANFPSGIMPWNGGLKVWHDTVFVMNPAKESDGWKMVGKMPRGNGYGVSVSTEQGVWMIGGGDAKENFSTVTVVKLDRDGALVFRDMPALPKPLANACGVLVGTTIHVVGGMNRPDATEAESVHYTYDLKADQGKWSEAPAYPGKGVMLASAASDGKSLFVFGGCSLHADDAGKPVRTYRKDAWSFSNGKWKPCAEMPRASVAAASPCWNRDGALHLVGGDDGAQVGQDPEKHRGFCKDVLAYDPDADAWKKARKLGIAVPVTLPSVEMDGAFYLLNGEVRPGVRTAEVTRLKWVDKE